MEALFTSTALVALAEIGDKTQLLALVLAARFRKPVPVIMGILVATLANHALAALLGATAASWLEGPWFSFLVALSFIVMGLWTLIPDKFDEDDEPKTSGSASLGPMHRSMIPTACASPPMMAGGCCAHRTPRTCWWRGRNPTARTGWNGCLARSTSS